MASPENLRVVFMGSDPIALPLLQWLSGPGRETATVVAVFTQPDRPVGRGQTVQPNAIKQWALAQGLPVHQPAKLTEQDQRDLAALRPDVSLVMAYGQILRDAFIAVPRLGTLNLHTSRLPAYRGASPIQTAVASGDRTTAVSLMRIVRELDAGPVADSETVAIEALDTAAEVEARLAEACVRLAARCLPQLAAGTLEFVPQEVAAASYCRKLTKADTALDFTAPAAQLAARINGLNPWPGCAVDIGGTVIKIGLADGGPADPGDVPARPEVALHPSLLPGAVIGYDGIGLRVATSEGVLRLRRLQRPGGKMLGAGEFLRGFPVAPGTILPSGTMNPLVGTEPFRAKKRIWLNLGAGPAHDQDYGTTVMARSAGLAACAAAPLSAQSNTDLINLREDINGLSQRLSELALKVEQLEANQSAASHLIKPPADAVTAAQLEAAVADLNAQLERLRSSVAAGPRSAATVTGTDTPVAAPTASAPKRDAGFATNFPKQGTMYTVQKGDTVALIAKKTGGKFQDIVNANKLADPSKIYPGQLLAIPGGK